MKGNCYQGCAYCCYRRRPGVATIYQRENGKIVVNRTVSDFRMVSGTRPEYGYTVYCPKNPKTGFDIIEEVNDDYNLISGLFKVKRQIRYKDQIQCSCFETKDSPKLSSFYAQAQYFVDEYHRMTFYPKI